MIGKKKVEILITTIITTIDKIDQKVITTETITITIIKKIMVIRITGIVTVNQILNLMLLLKVKVS